MDINLTLPTQTPYPITQTYQEHINRKAALKLAHYNPGIDYAAPTATPILAAASGVISQSALDLTGYGIYLKIDHPGGFATLYAHLSRPAVKIGQRVKQGQVIAFSDNTGNSTGPHLHFELRKNNTPIDPTPFLSFTPPSPLVGQDDVSPPNCKQLGIVPISGRGEERGGSEEKPEPGLSLATVIFPVRTRSFPDTSTDQNITGLLPAGLSLRILATLTDPHGNHWVKIAQTPPAYAAATFEDTQYIQTPE